jgi:hypothetical protein
MALTDPFVDSVESGIIVIKPRALPDDVELDCQRFRVEFECEVKYRRRYRALTF